MDVLFVFNHPAPYKVRLFNELSKEIKVTALFERLKNADRDPKFYNKEETKFDIVPIKGLNFGYENHFSFGIVKHLKTHNYDIVVMNGWHTISEMLAINYLKKSGKPYIFYINGGIIRSQESKFMKRLKTRYISGASLYFSPDENSNRYLTYYGAEASKIVNYPYSTIYEKEVLSKPLASEEKNNLRTKLGIKAEKLFVSCGQFIARKNYGRLIKYWAKQDRNHVLLLIGGGKEEHKYEKLIKEEKLTNVMLLDFVARQDLFQYFQASDVYLFPSKEDIYGHVINEALSQGLPIISNRDVNSALRLLKNGENGYVVDIDNDLEIDAAIAGVLKEPTMQVNALATARQNTLEQMAKVHLEIFNNWVSKK